MEEASGRFYKLLDVLPGHCPLAYIWTASTVTVTGSCADVQAGLDTLNASNVTVRGVGGAEMMWQWGGGGEGARIVGCGEEDGYREGRELHAWINWSLLLTWINWSLFHSPGPHDHTSTHLDHMVTCSCSATPCTAGLFHVQHIVGVCQQRRQQEEGLPHVGHRPHHRPAATAAATAAAALLLPA